MDFKNLYRNISVEDAMELMRRLFFKYQNVIPTAHLILELRQFLRIVIGTNLAPIFVNIYLAMLEEESMNICKNRNIFCSLLFKRFI